MVPPGEVMARIRDQALEVSRGWSGPDADAEWALVAGLFDTLASDAVLLRLAAEIPLERMPALLFVASLQRVVADHPEDPLARYYPGPDQQQPDAGLATAVRQFATLHTGELRRWFDRRYQMNEVGRCTQVALALGVVQRLAPARACALIDVGAGSGLGLHIDRYHVDLGAGRRFGPADSPVQLTCVVVGEPPMPLGPLDIALKIGIDAAPIDLDDADSRAWLSACTPPTVAALARLGSAIDITRAVGTSVDRADGPQVLAAIIDTVPEDLLAVVVDSYTAVFLDDDQRRAMGTAILDGHRDGVWISLDPLLPLGTAADRSVHDLPVAQALIDLNRAGGVFGLLSIVASIDGVRTASVLAVAHPSGTRMTWLDATLT